MDSRVSRLFVSLGCGLSSQFQPGRSIIARHIQFNQLNHPLYQHLYCESSQWGTHPKVVGIIESLISEQLVKLITGLNAVALVAIFGTENLGNIEEVPGLYVIVFCIPAVDVSLDSVTVVANDKPRDSEQVE